MKKAVLYARYSSNNQTEQSIEGQRRVCEEFAKSEGIQILREYIDRATSGTSADNREQFQQMLKDSKHGDWDYVLVYKLDRFSRNRYDSAIFKQKLKKNGVKVLSATERITDSPEGILIEGLIESMDEYYSSELARKCKRGIRESIIKGHNFGGSPLYGYKRENKKFVIDEATAENVRRIFGMYNSGATLQSIANTLNNEGYRTYNGNTFKRYTIYDILKNDKYTGIHYIDGIEEPEICPAIITREVYDKAAERLKKSAHNARESKTGHVFALTGLIKCGYCGRSICGTSTARKYFYYQCTGGGDGCNLSVNSEKLETAVIEALQDFFTADRVDELADRLYKLYTTDISTGKPTREQRLQEVEKQIQGAVKALVACPESRALQTALEDFERQRAEIEASEMKQPRLTREHFANFFQWLLHTLEHPDDRKSFFNTVIHSAVLFKDKIVIAINMTDENAQPPTFTEICKHFSDSVGGTSGYPYSNCQQA